MTNAAMKDLLENNGGFDALHFVSSRVHYCLPLVEIEQIIPMPALQVCPLSPPYISGLLNLHGYPVVVLDISVMLGTPGPERYNLDTSIILCKVGSQRTGIVASQIQGVDYVEDERMFKHSDRENEDSPFIAIVRSQELLSYILDLKWILAKCHLSEMDKVSLGASSDS